MKRKQYQSNKISSRLLSYSDGEDNENK